MNIGTPLNISGMFFNGKRELHNKKKECKKG